MAATATASPSHSQHNNDEQTQDPNPTQSPPHSETLETANLSNPNQSPLNSQQSDALLILDEDDQPPPPVTSPVNPQRRLNKRKKTAKGNTLKRKFSMIKAKNLTDILNPIPFIPTKKLDLDKHEEILKRLGLYDFSKIEFDRNIRTDLIVQLIVNYDSKKRCSYVNDFRINVNRAVFARALKLPTAKQDKGSSAVEEVDLDSEVFSDEAIGFIEDFVFNWMLLHEESWIMPTEIMNWTRCIRDGHPEKMDSASLIWYKVEKELTQGDKLVDCYYASHLQRLIRSQRELLFVEDHVVVDGEEVAKVDEEKEEIDVKEEEVETDVKEEKEESKEKEETKEKVEEKEEIEEKVEEKEEIEEKVEEVSIVQDHDIELTLGPDVEEIVDEEGKEDDEVMLDAEEYKVANEMEEQGNWQVDGKNVLDGHYLQRCQSSDLNNFEERKVEEVEDEQNEQMDEEAEAEGGERLDEGFDMEANDDSLDRDGMTDNFLRGVETSHNNTFNSHGMSSMDLFGSRDGTFMSHGGPSFFNDGGKRVLEPEEDVHHLDGNNKRLKTDDFGLCMEQMQQLMQKAKMIHESKEQSYEHSQYNQQLAMNELQERQNYMQMLLKSRDDALEKKHAEVFRLERELYLMVDLVKGYKKALDDTRFKFSEYRKRFALQEEPLYKDAGPGGLVLSTREIEKQRLQKQQEDKEKYVMMAKNVEDQCVYVLKMHHDKFLTMVEKFVSVENEVKKLKESFTLRKETQKELLVEPEENQKSMDQQELSADPEENQKSIDEQELTAVVEDNQKSVAEQELTAELKENQKSRDEILENDAGVESVTLDADGLKEKGGEEDLIREEC